MVNGTISGRVLDQDTMLPIQGASVSADDGAGTSGVTNSLVDGTFSLSLPATITGFTSTVSTYLFVILRNQTFFHPVSITNNDGFYNNKQVFFRVKFTRDTSGEIFFGRAFDLTFTSSPQNLGGQFTSTMQISVVPGRYTMQLQASLLSDFSVLESISTSAGNDISVPDCGVGKQVNLSTGACTTSSNNYIIINVTAGTNKECLVDDATVTLTGGFTGSGVTNVDGNFIISVSSSMSGMNVNVSSPTYGSMNLGNFGGIGQDYVIFGAGLTIPVCTGGKKWSCNLKSCV